MKTIYFIKSIRKRIALVCSFFLLVASCYGTALIGEFQEEVHQLENVKSSSFDTVLLFCFFIFIVFIVGILIHRFFDRSFQGIDSYSTHIASLNKLRALSILAAVIIPSVAYYESNILFIYEAHWILITVIVVSSLIALGISFYKKITANMINAVLGILLIIVITAIYLIAFERNLNQTLILEASIMLLFSKVIFSRVKYVAYFFLYIMALVALLIVIYLDVEDISLNTLNILISTTALSLLLTISLLIAEATSINNLSFANKILLNSDLFVLVADESGKIVYVSQPLLEATNKREQELLGLGWWRYRNETPGIGDYDIELNIKTTLEAGTRPKYINRLKTANEILDIEWSDFAIDGKFVMSIGKDVTEQVKSQEEIEMLSLVATSVTNGVVIMDSQNKLIWHNNQFTDLIGKNSLDIMGKDIIEELFLKDTIKGHVIEDMSQIEEFKSQTVRFTDHFGNEKIVMLSNSIAGKWDQEKKKILVWTDMTDQWKIEKRYKDIINNAFDNIYTANHKGDLTYVNKRMEMSLNTTAKQLIGRNFRDLIHPDDKEVTVRFYAEQFARKELYSYYEFRVKTNDDKDLWVGQNVRLVLDNSPKRKVIESHIVARDITESRENREELKRLSYVASNTENIVIILDKNFDIEWINNSFTRVFGYEIDEVLGKNPGDILNGRKTSSETLERITRCLKNREHVQEELLNYDKYGNEKWIAISMDPIFDEDQNIINYIAVENDISERKSQEILIKHQHASIIDSLNYASIIQSATLPTIKEIRDMNKDTFVYYRPKEIIGGDFYFVDSVTSNIGEDFEIYIVADCTGHGVPGAMLSVLCSSILKSAINNKKVNNPAEALSFTRDKLIKTLKRSEEHTLNDGMDLGMCAVNRANMVFEYSGASRPLFLVRDNEVFVIEGDKQSVGFNYQMNEFTYTKVPFEWGDTIYLFSDGIIDQFGGPRKKKFMTSRFKELLIHINHMSMDDQLEAVKTTLREWKDEEEQTDDICLMGIQLNEHRSQ